MILDPESEVDRLLHAYEKRVVPSLLSMPGFNMIRELEVLALMRDLVRDFSPRCFHADHYPGHFTASALVLNANLSSVVLTLHKKLKKWLPLGGHADGNFSLPDVALREAYEESGLQKLSFLDLFSPPTLPFDVDIYEIPGRPSTPAHKHYDVSFLIIAGDGELRVSDESDDLRWFSLEEASVLSHDEGLRRQLAKAMFLRRSKV
ncbi:MAG: NUDIX hydrolase [Oligoflexales bacterium]|nr:NUDIX hydrolase [Oligoflexales bacterium]